MKKEYYKALFREHRKINAGKNDFSQVIMDAVIVEMKKGKVTFLPKQVIKKIALQKTHDKAQVNFASKNFQGNLGLRNHM